jgi:N-dimethylarginine dimethylaminohydrolase
LTFQAGIVEIHSSLQLRIKSKIPPLDPSFLHPLIVLRYLAEVLSGIASALARICLINYQR